MQTERMSDGNDQELAALERELSTDLQDLRTATTVYAERAWQRAERRLDRSSAVRRGGWLAWAGAAVAAAVLGIGGVQLVHRTSSPAVHESRVASGQATAAPAQPNANVSDEALLDQIQSDLNTGVPAAMQPLAANTTSASNRNE